MSGLHHFRIRIVAAIGLPIWMAILLTCGSAGIAQPPVTVSDVETGTFQADDGWYFGYLGFRMLLQEKGLQQANDIEAALQSPRQSVVVILDNLSRTTRGEWLRLRRFVAQGGMLLVAGEESCEIPGVTRMASGPAETLNSSERYSEFSDVLVLPLDPRTLLDTLEQLRRTPVGLDSVLARTVQYGVAYHHAGMYSTV